MTHRQRLFRTLFLALTGLCIGAVIAAVTIMMESPGSKPARILASGVGGPFTLVDQDGKTRTEKDFSSSYKLIYFGFTYCPAICPTELQKMAEAMDQLPAATQARIQPIFISTDPERDTPAALKTYVALFDKRLIGLTGTPEQVEATKKTYKIYAAKVPLEGGNKDEYTIDHSSYIYFMTPDDQMAALYKTEDTSEKIAASIEGFFKDNP